MSKVSWNMDAKGKSGALVALFINGKGATKNIPAHMLRKTAKELNMPLTEKQLLERDAKRNIGEELLTAIQDVKAGRLGASHPKEVTEAVEARSKTGRSQMP